MNSSDIAFPKLSQQDIELLEPFYTIESYPDGHIFFREGDFNLTFYIVKSGEIEIFEASSGVRKIITSHVTNGFVGDVDMITGRVMMISAVAKGATEVFAINVRKLTDIFSLVPHVGETIIKAFIMRRQMLQETGFDGIKIIGSGFSADSFRIKEFLSRNRVPFTWIDLDKDVSMQKFLDHLKIKREETPVVICGQGRMLKNPNESEIAQSLGIKHTLSDDVYDVVIVGAGPAGLASAVYGASEGLKTLLLDSLAPGGQAGSSSKIENYLGFPTGVSGSELAARAILQANKFGAEISSPSRAVKFYRKNSYNIVELDDGKKVTGRTLVISTGASYRKLNLPEASRFDSLGVYYGATALEAQLCKNENVVVIGGGNSAGQAAMYLSEFAKKVFILIRRDTLSETMSKYLSDRILHSTQVELIKNTEVCRLEGDKYLKRVVIKNNKTGEEKTLESQSIFVFIGADPHSEWTSDLIATDENGFILTGSEAKHYKANPWPLARDPLFLETNLPGVFAVGDVRSRSVKRVASAVGEGSMAIQLIHQVLTN